jgi:hypothetical protein
MSKSYAEHLTHDRRLVILRLLKSNNGHGNDSVLLTGVRQVGHIAATREEIRADLEFLKERGALRVEYFEETIMVARLTERGLDCAEGRITIEGVKKPSLGGG